MICTTGMALVARLTAHDEKARGVAMSMTTMGIASGVSLGPTIGGLLFAIGGTMLAFIWLAGVTFVVVGITVPILFFHLRQQRSRTEATEAMAGHSRLASTTGDRNKEQSGMRTLCTVMSDGYMLVIYLAIFGCNFVYGMMEPTLGFWMHAFHYSAGMTGLTYLGFALPFLMSVPWMGFLGNRFGRPPLICLGLVILGSSYSTMTLSGGDLHGIVLTLAGMSLGVSCVDGCATALLAQVVDERHDGNIYGSALAIKSVFLSVGFVSGPVLGSALVEKVGFQASTLIGGLATVLIAPALLVFCLAPSKSSLANDKVLQMETSCECNV